MRRRTRRSRHSNFWVGAAIVAVVIFLCVILNYRGSSIKAQNIEDSKKIEKLNSELESEKQRTTDLEEYEKYVNTKQFIEDMAREKFGLIYPDEKVFRPED